MKIVTRVLVVEDDQAVRDVLTMELAADGFDVSAADCGNAALQHLERREADVMLLDLKMPGMNGLEVLKAVAAMDAPPEVIMLTAHADLSTAIAAMKLGAYDYLVKPAELDDITVLIEKAHEKRRLRTENIRLKSRLRRESENLSFVASSPAMIACVDAARRAAGSEFSVLITGESGVGKELLARFIHRESRRADYPFVAINCGAIPETMIESELFGHEKGAFTGAAGRKQGLIELADGGTLFLDEIGDMPPALQVKLLRVLESGRFYRLGGTREHEVDLRIISATNKDLSTEIERNTFRKDLYYRISALVLHIPPLRERREDIPLFIDQIRGEFPANRRKKFSADAVRLFKAYDWPGNVRELRNVVQRMLILSGKDEVTPEDVPGNFVKAPRPDGGDRLEDVERLHILGVLARTEGHREKAAAILGISSRTLRRKLQEYGVNE